MSTSLPENVLVIGGVALGPKAACRFKRLAPGSKVTIIDKSEFVSYGGCGIPFYVSGEVGTVDDLQSTPYHMKRDPEFFRKVKDVDVLTGAEAVAIDREAKTVRVKDVATGNERDMPYDKLVLAMGKSAKKFPIPGIDLPGVHTVTTLDQAEAVRNAVQEGQVDRAVVVGAGFIGLEMAVSLMDMWGVETEVVEVMDQAMPGAVSPLIGRMAQRIMEEEGVVFHLGEKVEEFVAGEDGRVAKVVTDKGEIEAQLVIFAAGVNPNSQIARDAGLDVTPWGGIVVDEHMRTSDPDIYSGGDCAAVKNLISGNPGFFPFGSLANRQGRVIGSHLAGLDASFPGAVGSFAAKLFEHAVAGAGLSPAGAKREGFDPVSVVIEQLDRAHFYPEKALMTLELTLDKNTGLVLGIHGFCANGDGLLARINPVASILGPDTTVEEISNLEVAYTPPFSSAMDVVNALGNVAENMLAGRYRAVDVPTFESMWEKRSSGEYVFLDCRETADAADLLEKHPESWCNIPEGDLRERLGELPEDKPVVLICNTGLRSYEAQRVLDEKGRTDTVNVMGGMAGVKKLGVDL